MRVYKYTNTCVYKVIEREKEKKLLEVVEKETLKKITKEAGQH